MIHKTTRSILSVLLAALLLVTSIPLTPAFAGDGGGAVSLQSESVEGRALEPADDGVYQISTAEELEEFADKVNDTSGQYTDIDAVLTADIDLSGICSEESDTSWTPIGNSESTAYTGTFDGNGKTISGLYIDSSSDNYQGLFGYVSGNVSTGGTVKDLSVSGTVSGNDFVGGVVGRNGGRITDCAFSGSVSGVGSVGGVVGDNRDTVENCYNTGTVTGSGGLVGGVVGWNDSGTVKNCYNIGAVSGGESVGGVVGDNGGTVENCYNTGSVSGSEYVGGVVGENSGSSTVENCYNTGAVSGGEGVGGVVGYNVGPVKNCRNIGEVSGNNYVGGVVGDNDGGRVENCYNTGSVTSSVTSSGSPVGGVVGYNRSGGSVTNSYNTGEVSGLDSGSDVGGVVGYNSSTVKNCYNTGTVTGPSTNVGGVVGDNRGPVENCYNTGNISGNVSGGVVGQNHGTVTNCYNTGKVTGSSVGGVVGNNFSSTVTDCYFLQQDPEIPGIGGGETTGATAVNDLTTLCDALESNATWTIHPVLGRPVLNENKEGGDGLPDSPYEISTADELKNFAIAVNGGEKSAHAVLMNNIDLSSVCGESLNSGTSWNPIGIINQQYSGTFDGNGKTISGLYIKNTSSDTGYQGLFGFVGRSGKVQNLRVSGTVSGNNFVGGVVGCNNGGTITGCIFSGSGSVSGSEDVGGVVGLNGGTVENCHNIGEVSGKISVGGVVGLNSGIVENCYNTGNVSGGSKGGVVGQTINNIITNCYFLQSTAESGIGEGSGDATAKDNTAFHSGEVAYLLQSKQADGSGQVWGQTLGGEEDSLPTLVALNPGAAQPVYKVTFKYGYDSASADEISYSNGSVKFPAFERTGHTLTGWQNEDGQAVTEPITVTADTTFTAQWTKDTVNYTVTVSADPEAGGTVSGSGEYSEGTQVTVTATPATGYHFVNWTENGTEVSTEATFTFNATVDRNLIAIFAKNEDPTPTPTPDPTPSGPSTGDSTGWDDILDELENTAKGDEITIDMGDETKVPAEIFESLAGKDVEISFDLGDVQWSVNGADIPTDTDFTDLDLGASLDTHGIPVNVINTITGEVGTVQITLAHDGEFGFTMTLTAPLGKENAGYWANLYHYDEDADQLTFETAAEIDADGSVSLPMSHASQYAIVIDTHSHATVDVSDLFIDIAPDAWYKDAVQYAYDNGLMTGVSATEFAPEQTTTRAMIVSILARLEGVTTAEAAGFADVDDEWYATAVNWAANVGVVNGYEDNTFKPNTAITREQLAAILMNYAAYKGEDVSNRADLTSYTDQPSTWAQEAMQWAVAEGLITGVTNTELQPQGNATRAQAAAILQRFLAQ